MSAVGPVFVSTVTEHSVNQGNWIHFQDSLTLTKLSTRATEPQKYSCTRTSVEKVPTNEAVLVGGRQDATDITSQTV